MRTPVLFLALASAACGGAPAEPATASTSTEERSGLTPEEAVQRCHDQGGPNRTDYAYVASYRCPDGSVPLGLDPARGAAARVGNVGAGPDGHVLDLYEVPCPGAPVRIYVDAYHCGDRNVDVDPENLSAAQLAHVAQQARALENAAFDPEALRLRQAMVEWLRQSPQVQLRSCPAVLEAVVHDEYEHRGLIFSQVVLSMAAASILEPDRSRADPVSVEVAGVEGALRLHDAIVRERGDGQADPELAQLVRLRDEGGLDARVRELSSQCSAPPPSQPPLGMVMSTEDGGNVWPPSGPECERLVRCCEDNGLVRNGAAVAGDAGPDVPDGGGAAGRRLPGGARDARRSGRRLRLTSVRANRHGHRERAAR